MTEKWAQQSHKAFPPCLAQRVHNAEFRNLIVSPATMDPPDVSDGINERASTSGAQRNRIRRNQASLRARKKKKAGHQDPGDLLRKGRRIPDSKCPAIW